MGFHGSVTYNHEDCISILEVFPGSFQKQHFGGMKPSEKEQHTHKHFDIGFSDSPRKGMAQRQGEASDHLKVFEKSVSRAA